MRLIDSDKFLQDMAKLYRQAGWDEREVHFSLADLRSNIGMEGTILIPQREPYTVPVIRCKDCRYYRWESDMCDEPYSTAQNVVHEDDFCSKAERKEHE